MPKIKNMGFEKTVDKTKVAFDKLVNQAKESVKVLETLQKEGLEKAKSMIHLPSPEETVRMTNEKISAGLQKLGLATRAEVQELEKKVEDLASELRGQISKLSRKNGS